METRNRGTGAKAEGKESPKSVGSKASSAAGDKKESSGKQAEPAKKPMTSAALTETIQTSENPAPADNSAKAAATKPSEGKKATDAQAEPEAEVKEEGSEGQPCSAYDNMKPYILGGAVIAGLALAIAVAFMLQRK